MPYNHPSDWDSAGNHSYVNLEQGERYRGASGQVYAHDGWPIRESAPEFDRYPMESRWDCEGWNASGRNASIRMAAGNTYRVRGQRYAHDGWPINEEAAPATTRVLEPTSGGGGRARESVRRRSPVRGSQYVAPRGPADDGWVPPGVVLPPRARYYGNDPDDGFVPCSRYPYQDDYSQDRRYDGNGYAVLPTVSETNYQLSVLTGSSTFSTVRFNFISSQFSSF